MSRRSRKPPVVAHSPTQAGPPQAMPMAGEFPAGPVGMEQSPVGPAPPKRGMTKARTPKTKHQRLR